MAFLTKDQQRELFAGCVPLSPRKVQLPDGRVLDSVRFNVLFGGFVFPLDDENREITRSANTALRRL